MPKNIVLLSDGTGNSAAKLLKTNVWRLYESLDLSDPSRQVACYDDGVGTSGFAPLALLGGAFGIGLRRNVLRLYRFLCEHYEPGDRIFLFGFSRGAFTVRVLAQMICTQGVIRGRSVPPPAALPEGAAAPDPGPGPTTAPAGAAAAGAAAGVAVAVAPSMAPPVFGGEMTRLARWAYRDMRRSFNQTGRLVTVARWARDGVLKVIDGLRGREPYSAARNHHPDELSFVGVWDTVDAYGLPIDELTQGVDRWVWPLSMPDLELHRKVKRACHALALDDERHTFHPVLWDEAASGQSQTCAHISEERITQVWFAGVHTNVGGGYADDGLSAVSLKWMVDQVSAAVPHGGPVLHFRPDVLQPYVQRANPLGRMYDPRRGIGGYYRYNPRKVRWLTNGLAHERVLFGGRHPKATAAANIERPKIHESVFTRIAAAPEAYAPIVLPGRYAVVTGSGEILDGARNPYETPQLAAAREQAQEASWDLVWWKRLVYFTAVGVTAFLLARPFGDAGVEAAARPSQGTAAVVVGSVLQWVPLPVGPWADYFTARPWELIAGLGVIVALSRIGGRLRGHICDRMRRIWLGVLQKPPVTPPPHRSRLLLVRGSRRYQGSYAILRRWVAPTVFGIGTLVWLAGAANRVAFEGLNSAGMFCQGGNPRSLEVGQSASGTFRSNEFCAPTGILLQKGRRYRMSIRLLDPAERVPARGGAGGSTGSGEGEPAGEWRDGNVRVAYSAAGFDAGTDGLTWYQRAIFAGAMPLRRMWTADWFVPIARIGAKGLDQHSLRSPAERDGSPFSQPVEITPRTAGELFLFVNDALVPVAWRTLYRNNTGAAEVFVTRLPDLPASD